MESVLLRAVHRRCSGNSVNGQTDVALSIYNDLINDTVKGWRPITIPTIRFMDDLKEDIRLVTLRNG